MDKLIKIYLDDLRPTPEGFIRAYTAAECIKLLQSFKYIDTLSLDHDLGACDKCMNGMTVDQWMEESNGQSMPHCEHVGTGYTVVLWIERQVYTDPDYQPPKTIIVHSANPVGCNIMQAGIKQIMQMEARKHEQPLWSRGNDCEGC